MSVPRDRDEIAALLEAASKYWELVEDEEHDWITLGAIAKLEDALTPAGILRGES